MFGTGLRAEAEAVYRLGPADKVRVTLLEQPTLNGEYAVGPAGTLSIPTVGEIEVAGLAPGEVGELIGDKLGLRTQQARTLVSVEIVEFRPFYITGSVNAPGSYPFVVGMTVLHAVSLAGGLIDGNQVTANQRLRLLRAQRELRQMESLLGLSIARRSRLQSELQERPSFAFPEEIHRYLDRGLLAEVEAAEKRAMQEMRDGMESERELAIRSIAIIEEQIEAYRGQYGTKIEEAELLEKDIVAFQKYDSAVSKTDTRQLLRLAAELRGEQLQLQALIAGAKERIERIRRELQRSQFRRRQVVSESLSELDNQIVDLRIRIEEAAGVLSALRASTGSGFDASRSDNVQFSIIRVTADGMRALPVLELTPVEPGDLIKVVTESYQAGSATRLLAE